MDAPPPLAVWIFTIVGVITIAVIGFAVTLLAWNQHRIAQEAKRWGRQVLAAQDAERQRIAAELHDDVVHRVGAARLALERSAVADATGQLGEIARILRKLAHELHPSGLGYTDLQMALGELVERGRSLEGPVLRLEIPHTCNVTGDVALTLYRVAQEGITNARKHANPTTITVRLESGEGAVRLIVEDDGTGIAPGVLSTTSFGIRSMRERLMTVGGTLKISAATPRGTRLVAQVRTA
jgi:signal transduction histidine kinase